LLSYVVPAQYSELGPLKSTRHWAASDNGALVFS
jgi:hypothetical protein